MGFTTKLMMEFQMYLAKKRIPVECPDCKEIVVPKREVSILNLIFYCIIAAVIFFITKRKVVVFLPIVLGIINSLVAKKRCPSCRGVGFIS